MELQRSVGDTNVDRSINLQSLQSSKAFGLKKKNLLIKDAKKLNCMPCYTLISYRFFFGSRR